MYRRLIVGYDATDLGRDALVLGRLLAEETGATLLLAHVAYAFAHDLPPIPGSDERERALLAEAEKVLSSACSALKPDLEVETRAVVSGSAARGLHELAEAEQADLIVIGSSHHGALGRVFAGSVGERLLHGSPCAVVVAPQGFRERADAALGVIAAAFDGSPESQAALATAATLAQAARATVHVLAVLEPQLMSGYAEVPPGYDYAELLRVQREHLGREVDRAVQSLPDEVRGDGAVLRGDAAEALAARAEEGLDLLVMGSRAYGPLRRVLLGGVSAKLMRSAPCPLLVVPRGVSAELDEHETSSASVGDTD